MFSKSSYVTLNVECFSLLAGYGRYPSVLRSDGGGEYISNSLNDYMKCRGIVHQTTAPYSPQQNGVAERKNRSIIEMARCLIMDAGLAKKYWGEAVNTAVYLQNRLPTRDFTKTPYEIWTGEKPNLAHIRVFGSVAYMHIPDVKRFKLDEKSKKLVLVGFCEVSKAYRLLDISNNKIFISRDVYFVENLRGEPIDDVTNESEEDICFIEAIKNNHDSDVEEVDQSSNNDGSSDQDEVVETFRRSNRENKGIPPVRYGLKCDVDLSSDPLSYEEATRSVDAYNWKKAMEREMKSLTDNETWCLVECPENRPVIGCKWVFKKKFGTDGSVNYKARLVAQGYSQKFGIDFDDVFAPVVRQVTFKTFLSIAGKNKYVIKQFDVSSAFLNGTIDKDVYMRQPEGFKSKANAVCQLKKSLYGLKQSAKIWNDHIDNVLNDIGFENCKADKCLYKKLVKGKYMFLLLYVDDILVAYENEVEIDNVYEKLQKRFDLKSMGLVKIFLGLEITKEGSDYMLCQSQYIDKVCHEFGLNDAKPSSYPIDPGYFKIKDIDVLPNNEQYRKIIGALLYISINSRPDISAAVAILSRKVESPTKTDLNEVKRVLRYLKATKEKRLRLSKAYKYGTIETFCDADWASDVIDRKSMSGVIIFFNGGPVHWFSRKQSLVTLSSTEAEYISLSEAGKEIKWFKMLLEDFNCQQTEPIIVNEDNQSCIRLASDEKSVNRSKHIDIKFHFIRDMVANNEIKLVYCPTEDMVADVLTKPIATNKYNSICCKMMLI